MSDQRPQATVQTTATGVVVGCDLMTTSLPVRAGQVQPRHITMAAYGHQQHCGQCSVSDALAQGDEVQVVEVARITMGQEESA